MLSKSQSCFNHPDVSAVSELMVEGGGVVAVCQPCREKMGPKITCKHCHVEMISRTDFRPVPLRSHKKSCPRHLRYG